MGKARSDSGYYWVDRKLTCNGCKYLNFLQVQDAGRNQPHWAGSSSLLPTQTETTTSPF